MGLKTLSIYPVLSLVLYIIVHQAKAKPDGTPMEAMVKNSLEKFEQNILETLQSYLQHHNNHVEQEYACETEFHKLQNNSNTRHKEVIEKFAAHESNIQQLAEFINTLRKNEKNSIHRESDLQEQLISMNNNLSIAQKDHLKPLEIMTKILLLSHVTLQEELTSMNESLLVCKSNLQTQLLSLKTDLRVSQSGLHKQLMSKNNDLQVSLSDVQKQLMSLKDELDQIKINVLPSSCTTMSIKSTNTYYIRPYGTAGKPFLVLCDFENNYKLGGGWTVFQRRFNGIENFYRNWTMYKNGFGDVYGEHWLGLEKLHLMTRMGRHELLVLLEDFEGKSTYALYKGFKVGSEADKYKLTVGEYSGTAGDSLRSHNGLKFTTFDQDNDLYLGKNCAKHFKGAWWFSDCYNSHLNGQYKKMSEIKHEDGGLIWMIKQSYSLRTTTMMLRNQV